MKTLTEQMLPGTSPIRMKRKLSKVAAALLFASAAITSSLTISASPTGQGSAPSNGIPPTTGARISPVNGGNRPAGNINPCVGDPRVYLTGSFAFDYSCVDLGTVPGVPFGWGGLTLKYDDPNTLLMGGACEHP